MNDIIDSNDDRLLALTVRSGVVAVGVYFMILTEMQRLRCAALTKKQLWRVLDIACGLDENLRADQCAEILDKIIEMDLLEGSMAM